MSTTNSKTPTQEIVDKCKEILLDEIKNAGSRKKAGITHKQAKKIIIKYKTCCLDKAEETQTFYGKLNLYTCIPGKKKTELLSEEVKKAIKKREDLEKKLKDAVAEIKKVKGKMTEAQDEACKLNRCWEEEKRCNLDLYKKLKDLEIKFGEEASIKFYTEDDSDNATKTIIDCTQTCYDKVTKAFDAGVNTVGIQTFVNVNALSAISDELNQKVQGFKKDIEDNVKKAADANKKAMEELGSCLEEEVKTAFDYCIAYTDCNSSSNTREYICNDECNNDTNEINTICQKLKDGIPSDPDDTCKETEEEMDTPKDENEKMKMKRDENDDWEL